MVCNLSLGDYGYSQAERDAVAYAVSKGTLVVAAAGNDGTNTNPLYPAALTNVLGVSATSAIPSSWATVAWNGITSATRAASPIESAR